MLFCINASYIVLSVKFGHLMATLRQAFIAEIRHFIDVTVEYST